MSYRHLRSGPSLALAISLVTAPLQAAEHAAGPFAQADDAPAVLSATRLPQSLLDVPAAVTVIDRQMIEQSGMREIPELLRLVPGMVVGYDTGSDVFVSFHGTAVDLARRMQVLIDGRSIYQPLLASVDWTGLPLELADIERIEVIRGPNSSTWGANSFLAVVNIVTRHPADVERARLSYRQGEDGVQDFLGRIARRTADVDWRLTVAGRQDDGFEQNLDPAKQRAGQGTFMDSKDVHSLYGRGVWSATTDASLEVAFGIARSDVQQQYRPSFFMRTPEAERENKYLSLAWEQDLTDSNQIRLQVNHSRFRREEPWIVRLPRIVFMPELGALYERNRACANGFLYAGDTSDCRPGDVALLTAIGTNVGNDPGWTVPGDFRSGLDTHERRTEVELHDLWVLSPDLRTVFGATFDEARVDSQVYLGGHAENTVVRLFAHGEWRFAPDWLLNVGGNQEFDEGAGNYFSPRYALNWQFVEGQVLRAVFSEAVRTPDILEEQAAFRYRAVGLTPADAPYGGTFFQSGIAAGDAQAERTSSSEIGYLGRFDVARITLDLRVFRDRLALAEHNLDPTETEGFAIRPLIKMRMTGSEFAFDWRPLASQRLQLNYAYLDLDGAPPGNDNTHFVPQHSGSVGWWQDYRGGWQVGTTYAFYNDLRVDVFFFDRLENRIAKTFTLPRSQQVVLAAVMQTRLTDEPELRKENGGDRHRGWFSLDWRY